MKNSRDVIQKIEEIYNLNEEVTKEVVKQEIEQAKHSKNSYLILKNIMKKDLDFGDKEIENKLINYYMENVPYIGYCHKYWKVKKQILKERYNIDWYMPSEENPYVIYD